MSNLCYKYKNQEDKQFYYYIPEGCFIINDKFLIVDYCEEYGIIQKIQKNEEGFFDFSKDMIDIGAADGNYAMLLDFKHNYCFEPSKRSACLTYANMYLKNKVDITNVYTVALGENEGVVKFDDFNCEGSSAYSEKANSKIYEVSMKTLDSYNFKNIGFIKIDVEGFEEKVVRGGLATIILNNYPPILFECWNVGQLGMTQEKRDSLFNLLKLLGYETFEYWGDHETHLAVHKTQLNK